MMEVNNLSNQGIDMRNINIPGLSDRIFSLLVKEKLVGIEDNNDNVGSEEMDEGKENEKELKEVEISLNGRLKGPDKFGNYIFGCNGKFFLLDRTGSILLGDVKSDILPYNDRYYICDVGKKCVFFDAQTGNVVEFTEVGNECKPKIYGKDEVCNDEFLIGLCKKSTQLYPNMSKESLLIGLQDFLQKSYLSIVLKKDIDEELRAKEAVSWTRESFPIISYLMGAYEYMYNGRITKYLAGKNDEVWRKLSESEVLKETYPDLYLAMKELDFLKNVLLDEKGNVIGYVKKVAGKYEYITEGSQTIVLDAFEGPDKNGNSIMGVNGKFYFVNEKCPFKGFGFDNIKGPDKNGNYLGYTDKKECLIFGSGKVLTKNSDKPEGNKPGYANFLSMCKGPDKNCNYIVSFGDVSTILIDSKGNILANYLSIKEPDINGNYIVVDLQHGSNVIDKAGSELFDERYHKITEKNGKYIKERKEKF